MFSLRKKLQNVNAYQNKRTISTKHTATLLRTPSNPMALLTYCNRVTKSNEKSEKRSICKREVPKGKRCSYWLPQTVFSGEFSMKHIPTLLCTTCCTHLVVQKSQIIVGEYVNKCLLTSPGNLRVKSYSVTIVTPVWCLVGRLFIISSMVSLPFSVGGGCRMRAGEFGGKPNESI